MPESIPERTPAAERICQAAVEHFADRGYDAASLNEIAEAVAIRKASLYSHFSGKDELYLAIFDDAIQLESDYAQRCLAAERGKELPGARYCAGMARRYSQSAHLRFLLKAAYLSPRHLQARMDASYERYLGLLLAGFKQRLLAWAEGQVLAPASVKLYGQAYLGIVDSLHVRLVYAGSEKFAARWQAMKHIFEHTLRQAVAEQA